MNTAIDTRKGLVKGSLGDVAQANKQSLAQTFVNAEVVVLVDTSGSMTTLDSRGGRSRHDVACEELARLQGQLPGKIGVISFADNAMFCPNGQPYNMSGSTNMAAALKFAKVADVPGIRFILISDGEPNEPGKTLEIAHTYRAKIDTIFVGPEGGAGQDFLRQLAAASGGSAVLSNRAANLLPVTLKLLAA
jgi:hypothetical protein